MREISVLIGGRAGDGINIAGMMIAQLFNHAGFRIFMNIDYPSLIRGGHNYAIVRASDAEICTFRNKADFVIALNKESIEKHRDKYFPDTVILANADQVRDAENGIPVKAILAAESAPDIMSNSAMIGGFAKAAGIDWALVQEVFSAHVPKNLDLNLKVARRAYDGMTVHRIVERGKNTPQPLVRGNEAIGLGLAGAGMDAYIAYPMTPSSSLLHFLAEEQERLGIMVIHPENEIAVAMMALGFAYAGKRTAVGTSGGGFCLMTEALSFAGMAEIPMVILVSQRTGPSTGLPTYSGQSELDFIIHAGHGEFPRLVLAPGDAREALCLSAAAMEIAWKFQIPAFIVADKMLSEGVYTMDAESVKSLPEPFLIPPWDGTGPYNRYSYSESGISPLAFPGTSGAVIKVDCYAHDEVGITTERQDIVSRMTEKRIMKEKSLAHEMEKSSGIVVSGVLDSETALFCWGSTKGACEEVAGRLGIRVVRPIVLWPFPEKEFARVAEGVKTWIAVEESATAQLGTRLRSRGVALQKTILKYDGRPFTPDELEVQVKEVLA
jgi:2-oxoglutarate ferredoxin oxidoreductase subunit alpha